MNNYINYTFEEISEFCWIMPCNLLTWCSSLTGECSKLYTLYIVMHPSLSPAATIFPASENLMLFLGALSYILIIIG